MYSVVVDTKQSPERNPKGPSTLRTAAALGLSLIAADPASATAPGRATIFAARTSDPIESVSAPRRKEAPSRSTENLRGRMRAWEQRVFRTSPVYDRRNERLHFHMDTSGEERAFFKVLSPDGGELFVECTLNACDATTFPVNMKKIDPENVESIKKVLENLEGKEPLELRLTSDPDPVHGKVWVAGTIMFTREHGRFVLIRPETVSSESVVLPPPSPDKANGR